MNNNVQDLFTFRFDTFDARQIRLLLVTIFGRQCVMFEMNLAFSFIMRNTVTDELSVYYASNNTRLFELPGFVGGRADLDRVLEQLDREDVLEYARRQRPSSHFVIEAILGMNVYVNKMSFPLH